MSEIRRWLDAIGLGHYADALDANEMGMDLLGQVDDQARKDIGVSIGGQITVSEDGRAHPHFRVLLWVREKEYFDWK